MYLNDPQKKWLDFPLVPGKKWSFRYPFEVGGTFIRDKYQVAEAEVVGPVAQPIKTPAGSFNVIKIRRTDWLRRTHADLTYYYSPETKSVVKLTADKSGHSGGRHYEMELMKYGHKEPVVQAPVYEDGDWWVFRVKSAATGISILIPDGEYKVTYKDGKFESDDPNFLTRNLNLPFVAVDLNDPQTKDFEFPLIPGKKWSFHYRGEGRVTLSRRWRFVDADIVRRVPQPLETRAGKFKVIEIRRTDWGRRGARLDFTYFYSPETKSVIKLTADLISAQEEPIGHFEMELIKYGRGATLSEQPIVKAPVIE